MNHRPATNIAIVALIAGALVPVTAAAAGANPGGLTGSRRGSSVGVVRSGLVVLVLGMALSGCADTSSPAPTEESAVDDSSPTPSPDVTQSTPPPGADSPAARQSVADLAASLGVDEVDVEVVAVEEVTWSDGSRGCARPGVMYTQALIEGSRITLRADGTTYEYHAGGSGPPALCKRPTQ